MNKATRRLATALLLCAAGAISPAWPQAVELPSPDLDGVEPPVRQQLEEAHRDAEAALADSGIAVTTQGERVGALGRLYLLYSLLGSAESCLESASVLAPEDPRWSYYLAVLLQRQGRFDEAAERLDAVAAARPRDPATLLRRGQVEIGRDEPDAAAVWFQRALEIDPGSSAALYGLAQVAARRGDPELAARLFTTVLEAQPTAATAHYQLGLVLRRLGDHESARHHLERAGRGEVVFPDPLMDQLAILAKGAAIRIAQATRAAGRGDLATARATLEAAVEADRGNLTARLALASNLIRQDLLDEAVAELGRVLDRDPDNAAAHYNLGTATAGRGDLDAAIGHLRRATELAPSFADAFVNLAGLLRRKGETDQALEALDRALAIEPGDVALQIQRAEALHRAGRGVAAVEALAATAPKTEGNAVLLVLLGRAREALGQDEAAVVAYRGAAALSGQDEAAEGARRAAALLGGQGRSEEALDLLDRALELRPGWSEVLRERAVVKGRLGQFGAAAADFAGVIETAPDDEPARLGRAVALLLGESYAEASRHFDESLAALPDSIDLAHAAARFFATCPVAELRDGKRALELGQHVVARQRSLEHGQTLAMALAELGRFDEAVALQRRLTDFAAASAPPAALAELRRRLANYERGEPERAPWLR